MKLLCTVSKILMCWKLCHETPIEDDWCRLRTLHPAQRRNNQVRPPNPYNGLGDVLTAWTSSIWPTPLTLDSTPPCAQAAAQLAVAGLPCRATTKRPARLSACAARRHRDRLRGARVHAMTMPLLLTPGARAAPSPSTLSRLLLPLHLQITNGRHNHRHGHVSASPLLYPRLRNRRGRFFASSSSSSQVRLASPPAAPGRP